MNQSRTEVADFFASVGADQRVSSGNSPADIYPGYPGLVLAHGQVQQMVWGFPLARKGAKGQALKPKPVNNARSDKLGSPFWSARFKSRRCLIPISEFAEAEGQKGAMTRTWFSLPDAPIFAVAGFWRGSEEWGDSYTMVMTEANSQIGTVHNRMPVVLPPSDWPQYLGEDPQAAFELCQPYADAMHVRRSDAPWAGRR